MHLDTWEDEACGLDTRAPTRGLDDLMPTVDAALRTAVLQPARFGIGAVASLDAFASTTRGASDSVVAELFKLADEPLRGALAERAPLVPVRIHGDSEFVHGSEFLVGPRDGVALTEHGASPIKLHTKALVADHERGVIGTAAPVPGLRELDTLDFYATFEGPTARALEDATLAAVSGDQTRIAATATGLARRGIFLNDPEHGVRLLTSRIESLVDGATDSIYVGSKVLDDKSVLKQLAAKQAAGVRVLVETTPKSTPKDVERARRLGLDVTHLEDEGRRLHGNLIVVDGREAYFGTAMVSRRGMAREADGVRPAREMGWFVRDPRAIDEAMGAVADLHPSRVTQFLGA